VPHPQLSPFVHSFIRDHLGTPDAVHVFAILIGQAEQWWTAGAVADRLGLPVPHARRILDEFVAGNVVDIRVSNDVSYRYDPGAPAVREAAEAFIEAFRGTPSAVMLAVRAGRRRSIEDFSNAFRIRRDDDR
jgi:hypothetical protein